jgi:hypothetical protein
MYFWIVPKKIRANLFFNVHLFLAVACLLVSGISSGAKTARDYGQQITSQPKPSDPQYVTDVVSQVTYTLSYSGKGALSNCKTDPPYFKQDKNSGARWYWSTDPNIDPKQDKGWTPFGDYKSCLHDVGTLKETLHFTKDDPRDIYIKAQICALTHGMFGQNPGLSCDNSNVLHVINMMSWYENAKITIQPSDQFTEDINKPCTFTSQGVGSPPLKIQWQKAKNINDWINIPGANSPKLEVRWEPPGVGDPVPAGSGKFHLKSAYSYQVIYSNNGTATSKPPVTCYYVSNVKNPQHMAPSK